jgi:uncharacterized Ntn-hydrolase superfamily protein
MRAGKTASEAMAGLLAADAQSSLRQVAMVDVDGGIAVHTGISCIAEAGHYSGAQYSVQANLMEKSTVWSAMARAYESSEGDLAERMLAALEAAQAEGGDIRGKQSAAILIVKAQSTGRPFADRVMDLRVEDHTEPVVELRRLVGVHRAYSHMNEGDEHLGTGNIDGALESYGAAARLLPDNPEVKFWAAIAMISEGKDDEARAYFKEVFAAEPKWKEVVRRLPASGLLDAGLVPKILSSDE